MAAEATSREALFDRRTESEPLYLPSSQTDDEAFIMKALDVRPDARAEDHVDAGETDVDKYPDRSHGHSVEKWEYSPLNDIESVLWIMYWVTYQRSPNLDSPFDDRAQHIVASLLFGAAAALKTKLLRKGLSDSKIASLHPSVIDLGIAIEQLRQDLLKVYRQVEEEPDSPGNTALVKQICRSMVRSLFALGESLNAKQITLRPLDAEDNDGDDNGPNNIAHNLRSPPTTPTGMRKKIQLRKDTD